MTTTNKSHLFIYISITVLVIIILKLIDFNGLYAQDSHEYLRYTKYLKSSILNFEKPDNYFWPVMYPLIGSILGLTTIPEIFILQSVSILSYIITAIYINKIIQLQFRKNAYTYVGLFFLLSPMVFRMGTVIMSDMLCLCFLTIGYYHLLKYDSIKEFKNLVFSVAFFSLSFHSRYVSVVIFLFPFLYFFIKNIKQHLFHKYILLLLVAILISIPHIIIKTSSLSTFNHSWLLDWNFFNFFKSEFNTTEGFRPYKIPNVLFLLIQNIHPRYFFIGVALILFLKLKDLKSIILIGIVTYLFFLGGIPLQNNRFILLTFPLVLIILFPAYERALSKIQINKNIIIIGIICIQLAFNFYSFNKVYNLNKEEKNNVSEINKVSPLKIIYTSGYEGPLRSYSNKDEIKGLWTDTIKFYKKPSLLMINDQQMTDDDLHPIPKYNYINIKKKYILKELKTFEKGWKLYEIQ